MSLVVVDREVDGPSVYVLWSRQHDGSGHEMLRVYSDGVEALKDAELIGNLAMTEIRLERVPTHGSNTARPLPSRPQKPDDDIPF